MPFLSLTNLLMSGKLTVVPKMGGPEYTASEALILNNAPAKAFGFAMAASGNSVAVGAYSSAKAFVYEYDGTNWNKTAEWTKSGRFGYKVAIDGDWAAVANTPTSGNGSVFLYRRVGGVWGTTEHSIINVEVGVSATGFASSVSMHNGTLVVGHTKINGVGGAHVYVWNGTSWAKQGGVLSVASNLTRAGNSQNLGLEVAVHGDIIAVGGSGDTLGRGYGLAFVSKRTAGVWSNPVVIKPETTYLDGYGWAVKVRGNTVVVGAPYGNAADKIPGRAFVYDYTTATPELSKIFTVRTDKSELIQDPLMTTGDSYGWAVEISEDEKVILVGAVNRNGNRGIAYVYEKLNNVWGISAIPNSWFIASNGAANNRFGSAIVHVQDGFLIGAYGLGAFYWFK